MSLPEPYYQEEGIQIYHGDCREILPDLDPSSISLVLTDPPYGIDLNTNYYRPSTPLSKSYARVHGDDAPFDPEHLLRFGKCILFGANHYTDRLPMSRGWLVWDKVTSNDIRPAQLSDAELIWTNCSPRIRVFRHMWNGAYRSTERKFHIHPTQKPVALMEWILVHWSSVGDVVLDPYLGSGPTLKAAKNLGRKAIGIEICEEYCEIAARRLQQEVLPLEAL